MSKARHYANIPGVNPSAFEAARRRDRLKAAQRRSEIALIFLAGTALGSALTNLMILWGGM